MLSCTTACSPVWRAENVPNLTAVWGLGDETVILPVRQSQLLFSTIGYHLSLESRLNAQLLWSCSDRSRQDFCDGSQWTTTATPKETFENRWLTHWVSGKSHLLFAVPPHCSFTVLAKRWNYSGWGVGGLGVGQRAWIKATKCRETKEKSCIVWKWHPEFVSDRIDIKCIEQDL